MTGNNQRDRIPRTSRAGGTRRPWPVNLHSQSRIRAGLAIGNTEESSPHTLKEFAALNIEWNGEVTTLTSKVFV